MSQRAVHLGTGSLGLGLTCWALSSLGLEVVAVNRTSLNDNRNDTLKSSGRFGIRYPSNRLEQLTINNFLYVPSQLKDVLELVRDPETIILTTALKEEGIFGMRETLRDLFIARSEFDSALLFIACENAISSQKAFNDIVEGLPEVTKNAIRKAVFPVNCVVDRICNKPILENGMVVVTSEEFARWSIEESQVSRDIIAPLLRKQKTPTVELVTAIDPYVLRKKWVVNALHLSAAILAHSQGYPLIDDFLKKQVHHDFFIALAKELRSVFEVCLLKRIGKSIFDENQLKTYFEDTFTRISTHPQKVSDATTRLKKGMIFEFIKDFDRKVVEPFLMYTETSGAKNLRCIPTVIGLVDSIIANERFL